MLRGYVIVAGAITLLGGVVLYVRLSHRFTLERKSASLMNKTVENRVREWRILKPRVPVFQGQFGVAP